MNCPICQSHLERGSDRKYVTTVEHVGSINLPTRLRTTFICPNKCNGVDQAHGDGFWDSDGDFYGYPGKPAALNSWAKKIEVEIYKKDENYVWKQWRGFTFEKIFHYQSNYMGEILQRTHEYQLTVGNIIVSRGKWPITAFFKGIYSEIFRFGCGYWTTFPEKVKGVWGNLKRFWSAWSNACKPVVK